MNKTDVAVLKRGLKRVGIALLTAATFVASLTGLIVTAIATGYLAVALFLCSVVAMVLAFVLLYAQGITHGTHTESKGETK